MHGPAGRGDRRNLGEIVFWIWLWYRNHKRGVRNRWWVLLLVALLCFGAVAVGISMAHGEPDCEGQVLHTGQVCRYSDGTVKDYAKEKSEDQGAGVALAIVAGIVGVIC